MEKENKQKLKIWILTGNEENWETAIRDSVWGVREGRLKKYWDKLNRGDILIFYAKAPTSGIIGVGITENKFKQDKPLWPDEVRERKVIYPYRFEFQAIHYLLIDKWRNENISIRDLKVGFQAGMNPMANPDTIDEILLRIERKWNIKLPSFEYEVKEKKQIKKEKISLHDQIKEKLYQIGQLERFYCEKEYPIDNERLDVVWRRAPNPKAVPTRAFEVQISGSIHQAIAKLKHAYDLWNSEPFLIIKKEDKSKVDELLSGTFHEVADIIKVITTNKIEELYDHLLSKKTLKEELGLL